MDKNFQRFVDYHWKYFFGWVKTFYPIPLDIIEAYIDEFALHGRQAPSLGGLTSNSSIQWTRDFVIKNRKLLFNSWIFKNEELVWDKELVDIFAGNINWHMLSFNKSLVLNEELIECYKDEIIWKKIIVNPNWTEELKNKYGHLIESWDSSKLIQPNRIDREYELSSYLNGDKNENIIFLKKHHIKPDKYPSQLTLEELEKIKERAFRAKSKLWSLNLWPKVQCIDFDFFFNHSYEVTWGTPITSFHNIYKNLVEPYLDDDTLRNIFFRKYPYNQKYCYLKAGYDDIGLVPSIDSRYAKIENEPIEKDFLEEGTVLSLRLDDGFEGPERLVDLQKFFTMGASLVISDALKDIFSNFKLPEHRYYKVTFNSRNEKIKNQTRWLLHLAHDTLNRDIDYSAEKNWVIGVSAKGTVTASFKTVSKENLTVKSAKELYNIRTELANEDVHYSERKQIRPHQYILTTDYDIYTQYGRVIVNEFVKKAIEQANAQGAQFESANNLRISIDQSAYDEKANIFNQVTINPFDKADFRTDEYKFFEAKMKRLQSSKSAFSMSKSITTVPEWREVEERLQVLLPSKFDKIYREDYGQYELLPPEQIRIMTGYESRHPASYKALVFAWNGIGDYLGLFLEQGSDYQLGNTVYEFHHEIGEITKLYSF